MSNAPNPYEAQLVQNLPLIERIVGALARRYGMGEDDAAELSSAIKLRIVEDDYAVFRKFRGESALPTYLTVVIAMMAREHRVAARGRWRPSAASQRIGPVAVKLETLVAQKGYALAEAGEIMRSSGETTLTDRQLGDLLRQLPRRAPLRPIDVGAEPLQSAAAGDDAEARVVAAEASARRASMQKVLEETLAALPLEDRLLLKLRFWQEASIADAARILGVEQRPLYRRIEKVMNDLRARLAGAGITVDQVRELIGGSA